MTEDGPRRSRGITLQCGLARETYGFEGKDLNALKELACSFLDQKVQIANPLLRPDALSAVKLSLI